MTTQHLSFISLLVVRMLFLLFACMILPSCEDSSSSSPREKSPQELVVIIKNEGPKQAAAVQHLLSMSGKDAGKAQEEVGDFFELKVYEVAEKFWEAARQNGRPDAGPKHSLIWRLICTHPWWTLLIIGGFIVSFIIYISIRLDKQEKKRSQDELEHRQRELRNRQQEEERTRAEYQQEQQRKKREAQQRVLQSAWWNIPNDSILVFDTCVLMKDTPGLNIWLAWITAKSTEKRLKLCIIKHVYHEILNHKANGSHNEQYGARVALRRIEAMQKITESCVEVGCEGSLKRIYADNPLVEYICRNERAILLTDDRELGIRVRNAKGCAHVLMLDDFEPYPGKFE